MGRWVSKKQACDYASASKKVIEQWMRDGLVYIKLPTGTVRMHTDDIDRYLRRYLVNRYTRQVQASADSILEKI